MELPVPERLSITQISPAGTVSDTSPQISCLPKDLLRCSTLISTPMTAFVPPSLLRARARPHPHPVSLTGITGRSRSKLRVGFLPRVTPATPGSTGRLDRGGRNATRGGPPCRVDRPSKRYG